MAKINVIKQNKETVFPVSIDEAIVVTKDKVKLSDKLNDIDNALDSVTAYCVEQRQARSSSGATNSSPTLSSKLGNKTKLLETLSHFKVATIKDGVVTHICAPGRLFQDEGGRKVKIDGTDGDVVLYVNRPIYDGKGRITGTDNTSINTLGLGLTPFYIGDGQAAKKYDRFFIGADYDTYTKGFSEDSNNSAIYSHCIFNKEIPNASIQQSYNSINVDSSDYIFTAESVWKKSRIGYPSYTSNLASSHYARNKNLNLNSSTRVYQGQYYGWNEIFWEALYLELGSLNI